MTSGGRRVLPDDVVIAVVVTKDRPDTLADSLDAVCRQTRRVDRVVVVDNGADPKVAEIVERLDLPTTYLPSRRNLGGAGGFALGMLQALALGADWVWCADDDGRPESEDVLATLLRTAVEESLDEVSPMVADIDHPDRLAFPLRRGLRWRRRRTDFRNLRVLRGYASLFNGALFRAEALEVVGVPDYRMFFRGDETEMHRRLLRSGLRFGTATSVAYLHPNGSDEFKPMLGEALSAQYPDDPVKRYYTYRNRGYLMAQPGMRWLLPLEWFRFSWYFLVSRHDAAGWREWRRLTHEGRSEHFTRR
ncbi:MAG: putative glycosyltransferase [Frankiales bacterium]|nr:putative glycosyltransferase [Frankiales bacterium]